MKKIKYLLLSLLLIGVFSFNKTVNAEEEDCSSSATTDEVIEDNTTLEDIEFEETTNESDLAIWFNDNLGWLVGIPTGTILATIAEIIILSKKNKNKKDEIKETSSQNKYARQVLDTTKDLLSNTKILASRLETNVADVLKQNEEKTALIVKGLNQLTTSITNLELRLNHLEEVQEMIALHSKELVANGTAEKITKKIRG